MNTAYYRQGHLIVDKSELQRNYFQENFYKDILVVTVYYVSLFSKKSTGDVQQQFFIDCLANENRTSF